MIVGWEGMTQLEEDEAKGILDALTVAYPGHPWSVRVFGGVAYIKHLEFDGPWGMVVKLKDHYSASQLKRESILMAGEWLERASLVRGRANDDPTKRVEGVPEKWQPAEFREKKQIPNVVIAANEYTPLRDEPRGHIKEEEENDRLPKIIT